VNDIWYLLQDHERYVYHYTKAGTLLDSLLPTGEFRFSRLENVNDPRESKAWLFNYYSAARLPEFDADAVGAKLNDLLKHSWRMGCFVADPYEAVITKAREDRGEDIHAAPYERGHSRPRMWAQYGENYEGACLVFDRIKLDADIRAACGDTVCAGRVEYRNPPIPNVFPPSALTVSMDEIAGLGFSGAMDRHVTQHWKNLFFVKTRDWEQEREYRWVVRGGLHDEFRVDIRNSLVGILLGDRFPPGGKAAVGRFAESNGVSIATMNWQNGLPQPSPTHWRLLIGSP
jgi:hypothetical protein